MHYLHRQQKRLKKKRRISKVKRNYLNVELCKKCEGKCCKMLPGIAYPVDFKSPLAKSLVEAFKSGKWAIDWYEGDPTKGDSFNQVYFVRPRIKGVKELFDPAWGGECIFLTEKGCTLLPLTRPKACRLMEPVTLEHCILHAGDKAAAARAWLLYQDIILVAAKEFGEGVEDAASHSALEGLMYI